MIEEITTSKIEEPVEAASGSHNHSSVKVEYSWA